MGYKIMRSIAALLLAGATCATETFIGQDVPNGPMDTTWNFTGDGDDKNLPDNDHIKLTKVCDVGIPTGYVRFGLRESGTWWKSVTVFTMDQHFLYELVAVQDAPGVIKYADVPHTNLDLYKYEL